jgi:epoxyqueuosine reductase
LSALPKLDRLRDLVQRKAIEWGSDLIGFANIERFDRYPLERRPPERTQTVIVLAIWMDDPILDLWLHSPHWQASGKPSRAFEDEILRGVSLRLSLLLEREGYWAEPAPYEPGLYLKEAGVLAGLGVIGKNNLLITKEYGPRVRLRAVNTSALLRPTTLVENYSPCNHCHQCIDECPAKAFTTGKYHQDACLTYSQTHLQEVSKYAVLWCMRCSTVCPVGEDKRNQ